MDVLNTRIQERAAELERREAQKVRPAVYGSLPCRDCQNAATGTGWVAYHNRAAMLEVFPLCDAHSYFDDKDNRPHGFIPEIITMVSSEIQRHLRLANTACSGQERAESTPAPLPSN
jgi:hypothetical protein